MEREGGRRGKRGISEEVEERETEDENREGGKKGEQTK